MTATKGIHVHTHPVVGKGGPYTVTYTTTPSTVTLSICSWSHQVSPSPSINLLLKSGTIASVTMSTLQVQGGRGLSEPDGRVQR